MSTFIIPEGKKAGCLPRSTKIGAACPLFGERIKVLSEADIRDAIAERKKANRLNRAFVDEILDQDGVGSCATEALAQGVKTRKRMSGRDCPTLSPWFIYYHSSGGVDRGSSIDENLALARDIGIPPMSVWPRSKGWRTKPSEEAFAAALDNRIVEFYDITTIQEVRTALVLDFIIEFGHDSHAELMTDLVEYDGGDVVNSWGNWEDGGWHNKPFPLSRINFQYGAFAFRVVE